jgi:4-alpha-glucanotransferase
MTERSAAAPVVEVRPRYAGVLLHPTSLPGPYGIGDLGSRAYQWVDALAHAQQSFWQILPLNPTGFGDSPYQSFSAFAGNPYLISPDLMAEDGLLLGGDLHPPGFPADRVDYGAVIEFKTRLLHRAWERFQGGAAPGLRAAYEEFRSAQKKWLDDYALFRAIKAAQGGKSWYQWSRDHIDRKPAALDKTRKELADAVGYAAFGQFLFFRQWGAVKKYANERGIRIIGDVPIFVSGDSADVWSHPDLFQLDEHKNPKSVAGVPPDYFSATGQLWGNPLYDWPAVQKTGFRWWIDRMQTTLNMVDVVRLDHFRGFEAYWAVPAGMPTAEKGQWVKAPGQELFNTLKVFLNGLPLIAEDLGLITPEVNRLRRQFNLPGMRILQFAFDGRADNPYLPHNYDPNTVVYTGTHDNNTTRGWYNTASETEKDHVRRYLGRDGRDIVWDLIRVAWESVADYALAPLQDVLDLGTEARMNFPGRPGGNWTWRFREDMLRPDVLDRLANLTELYGR